MAKSPDLPRSRLTRSSRCSLCALAQSLWCSCRLLARFCWANTSTRPEASWINQKVKLSTHFKFRLLGKICVILLTGWILGLGFLQRTLFLPQNQDIRTRCSELVASCLPVMSPGIVLTLYTGCCHDALRSVFPELAKYTMLAFSAQFGIDVMYVDMDSRCIGLPARRIRLGHRKLLNSKQVARHANPGHILDSESLPEVAGAL